MTSDKQILEQALACLEESYSYVEEDAENAERMYGKYPTRQARIQGLKDEARKHWDAITALREALAEQPKVWVTPKLRPLAKLAKELDGVVADVEQGDGFDDVCLDTVKYVRDELAEQPAQQQEPVAWVHIQGRHKELSHLPLDDGEISRGWEQYPLHTSPPAQRKPLTDEEIEKLREKTFSTGNPYCPVDSKSMRKAARAIEAAHGIKE